MFTIGAPARAPHGAIIAGGRGTRLGRGPKYNVTLAGRSLLSHVRARIEPQLARLALNLNDPAPAEAQGLALLADHDAGRGGPLMGILRALEWARGEGARHVLTVPVDTPFLPLDLVARLSAGSGGGAAFAASGGHGHFICALWPVSVHDSVHTLAMESGIRRVDHVLDALDAAQIEFPHRPFDPFFNINRAEDLAYAEELCARS